MRQIESAMLAAIAARQPFKQGNTEVRVDGISARVYLHGNLIAVKNDGENRWRFNLCGWNTPTTRSRLNALGAGVFTRAGLPLVAGRAVPVDGFWEAA